METNPGNPEAIGGFETVRHGEKEGESLSARGIEQAIEKAHELAAEIENSLNGTVFYLLPSNVGRAVATRDTIETELQELLAEDKKVAMVDVHDLKALHLAKEDHEGKYVVKSLQPSSLLGFNENTPSIPAFLKYKKLFQNNETYIGKVWAVNAEELQELKRQIAIDFPDLPDDSIDPREFQETPEEAAIKYLNLMKRMADITRKHFPGRPWKSLLIGHNLSADFAVMAMMGKKISLESTRELGDEFRRFMESSYLDFEDDKIVVRYRDEETERATSLDEVMNSLLAESKVRRENWSLLDVEREQDQDTA